MRSFILTGAFVCLTISVFGQGHPGPYWSLGGFGNVVYPGTGHAPNATPPGAGAFSNNFQRGGTVASHPQHRRSNIVLYPVYYGGYGAGYGPGYGAGYACDPSQGCAPGSGYGGDQAPVVNSGVPGVVINQNFVPPQANPLVREYGPGDANGDQSSSGFRMYQAPTPGQMTTQVQQAPSDQPTVYLIAFKDHSIVQALGYWMEGSTLHYVTVDHDLNQVSLNLIDRDLSQRLNNERNVEFRLPAAR